MRTGSQTSSFRERARNRPLAEMAGKGQAASRAVQRKSTDASLTKSDLEKLATLALRAAASRAKKALTSIESRDWRGGDRGTDRI